MPVLQLEIEVTTTGELIKREQYLRQREQPADAFQMMLASEAVLRRDWDRPEADEAWADL